MLKLVVLIGLATSTLSAFMLGAVTGVAIAGGDALASVQATPPARSDGLTDKTAPAPESGAGALQESVEPAPHDTTPITVAAAPDAAPRPRATAADEPIGAHADPVSAEGATLSAAETAQGAVRGVEPQAYMLLAGSFMREAEANRFAASLGAVAFPARISSRMDIGGQEWFSVAIGPYASAAQAARAVDGVRRAFAITPVIQAAELTR